MERVDLNALQFVQSHVSGLGTSRSTSTASLGSARSDRAFADRRAGIIFDKELQFQELAEWVGKRLELASLKASYQTH